MIENREYLLHLVNHHFPPKMTMSWGSPLVSNAARCFAVSALLLTPGVDTSGEQLRFARWVWGCRQPSAMIPSMDGLLNPYRCWLLGGFLKLDLLRLPLIGQQNEAMFRVSWLNIGLTHMKAREGMKYR